MLFDFAEIELTDEVRLFVRHSKSKTIDHPNSVYKIKTHDDD